MTGNPAKRQKTKTCGNTTEQTSQATSCDLPDVTSKQPDMAEPETTLTWSAVPFHESDTMTLLVGPDEHRLTVHESFVTRTFDFLKAAMKKKWAEGQTRTIKLPEETSFPIFVHYLTFAYGGRLPTEEAKKADRYRVLVEIYVLGERMLDKCVQHAVIEEIIRLSMIRSKKMQSQFPSAATITIAYEGTSAGSPIRRLLVDQRVEFGDGKKSTLR